MGWWKVQGKDVVLGDEPLDILNRATRQVVESYRREFERKPTRAEWECLLKDALEPIELADPGQRTNQDSMFAEGWRPTALRIAVRSFEAKDPNISNVAHACQQIAADFGFKVTVGESDAFVRELLFGKFDLWRSLDEALITRDEFLNAVLVRFLDWARARVSQPIEAISRENYDKELASLGAAIFD